MDTITINGREFVRLNDVCDILRHIVDDHMIENGDNVVSLIAHCMFYDEVMKGETEEERESACELPGDFVIYRELGHVNPNGKTRMWFTGFANKTEARATDCAKNAAVFKYKSMADHVAEMLGKDWKVVCVGREHKRIEKRILDWLDEMLSSADSEE